MSRPDDDLGGEWIVVVLMFLILMGALATISTFIYMMWSAIKWLI